MWMQLLKQNLKVVRRACVVIHAFDSMHNYCEIGVSGFTFLLCASVVPDYVKYQQPTTISLSHNKNNMVP